MAIVLPMLLLVVFGLIEFGFAINHNIYVTQGVREAGRQGAVANFSGGVGSCGGSPTDQLVCFTKNRVGLDTTKTAVHVIAPASPAVVGNQFAVCASYPVESLTGLLAPFLSGRFLHSEVKMRLEQAPATGLTTDANSPPAGDVAWSSWCTPPLP
jgi:hypothetical protein